MDAGAGGRMRARAATQARGRGASYILYPTLTPNGKNTFLGLVNTFLGLVGGSGLVNGSARFKIHNSAIFWVW